MLLTKTIEVTLRGNTIKHYSSILNVTYTKLDIGKVLEVDINLIKNSRIIVDVACDICNLTNNISLTSYRNSVEYNFYSCQKCKHIKRKMTNLEKHGIENYQNIEKRKETMISEYGAYYNNREKSKETCLIEYGVDNVSKIKEVKNRKKETTNENYGVDNPFQSEEIKNRIQIKHLENLGVKHPSQSESIKEMKRQTCLINLGVEYPTQSKETIDKSRKTFLEKYNVDWLTKSDEYKEMVKETNNKIHGCDWYLSSVEFKEKSKTTNNIKYGVDYVSQNIEIFNKQQKSGFNLKKYNNLNYRGTYELDFIQLCEQYNLNILNGPTIKYNHQDKNSIYFSDFIIPEKNLILEIKSSYTYKRYLDKNISKRNACIKQGYNFLFIIDRNYDEFLKLIQ